MNDQVRKDSETQERMRRVRYEDAKYRDALERIRELETKLDDFTTIEAACVAKPIVPLADSKTSEGTMVALASDWHVEELVDPKTVQGRNKYNPDVARARAQGFFQRIVKLTEKERQDVRIDNLVLGLLGDFYSGAIHDSLPEICAMRPVDAVIYAEELIASGLQFLLDHGKFKKITLVCKVGNHSRITKKVHVATEQGNSLEYGMYFSLARRFPQCAWLIEPSYHSYLTVYGRTLRFAHGHEIKSQGGVGGIYPALLRAEHQWDKTQQAHHSMMGHFHQYTCVGRGNIVINGSLIGYTPYGATKARAVFDVPTQALFLLDKKRGVTVPIPILL